MGFFSFLDSIRSKPRPKAAIELESPGRQRQVFQESSSRWQNGPVTKTAASGAATEVSGPNNASARRKSMSRRRSWFGGKPDADEDVPAMPTLVKTDYNSPADLKRPNLGRSRKSNGGEYYQLPSDKQDKRTSSFASRQDVTPVSVLPPLPGGQPSASHATGQATSTLPDEQRRNRRASMKSHHRSNSQASTKSRRKSRSFWGSSNPDDEEDVPPVPALKSHQRSSSRASTKSRRKSWGLWASSNPDDTDEDVPPVPALTPDDMRNDPMDSVSSPRGRARSPTDRSGPKEPRPFSTCSRKSYTPRSAAAGFLKSTNGASDEQRKSYRRSFKLGENVELVCVTDEQRLEWEKLMNKNGKLEDAVFAAMGRASDEEGSGYGFSNAQALAALEFGTRA